ncbi:MAG: hypothetical protein KDA75_12800, partial [Planctomycetaceae bacterium]|nr:hypothetical protein [Planctomycetaceae bacterium]
MGVTRRELPRRKSPLGPELDRKLERTDVLIRLHSRRQPAGRIELRRDDSRRQGLASSLLAGALRERDVVIDLEVDRR